MVDFSPILNKKMDEIKAPEPVPSGDYECFITGFEFKAVGQKENPACIVNFKLIRALEGVDTEALANVNNWNEKELRTTFWLTDDAEYRFREFLEALGIETSGKTLGQSAEEMRGKQATVNVAHRMVQEGDKTRIFMDFKSFSPIR